MQEQIRPSFIRRIPRNCDEGGFCRESHEDIHIGYCERCQAFHSSTGCHGNLYVFAAGARCGNRFENTLKSGLGVYFGPGSKHNLSILLPRETSWRAELQAAIMAIKDASNIVDSACSVGSSTGPNSSRKRRSHGRRTIVLLTDSKYVCNTFNKWMDDWQENGWIKRNGDYACNLDLIETLYKLKYNQDNWNLEVVHIEKAENEDANRLAKNSRNMLISGYFPPTGAHNSHHSRVGS